MSSQQQRDRVREMASEKFSIQKLSGLISRSLCISGLGSYATELAKNKTSVTDYLYFSASNELEVFEGGSVSEGTVTSGSDTDRMIVVPGISVKMSEANQDVLEKTGSEFLLDTSKSKSGYARLRLINLADTNNVLFEGYDVDISEVLEETTEGIFLSSEKFANFFVSAPVRHGLPESYFRHGPCATSEHVDMRGYITGKPGVCKEADIAHALACQEWPVEAKEWEKRKRLHDWPSPALIKRISKKRCFVVPIGSLQSQYQALEWRISYLLGERELVWSFNDTQLHCYFFLKGLLKLFLDRIAPDQLSSYNMKTIVFWLSEEKGLSMWNQENLLACVQECLDRLSNCIQSRLLPHYFNCKANLFGHKFQNDAQREHVLEKIKEIKANITTFVLDCLPPEWKWPKIMKKSPSETCSKCSEKLNAEFEFLENDFATTKKAHEVYHLYRVMFNVLLQVTTQNVEARCILRQLMAFENNPPRECDILFIEMTKTFLDLRFAMAYFREITVHEDKDFQTFIESKNITKEAMTKLLAHAGTMDAMSGELYLATIQHFLGNYATSIKIVNKVLHQTKRLVYSGWCSTYRCIQLTGDGLSKQVSGIKLCGEEGRTYAAYDVIFSHQDIYCVPYPIKFECALAGLDTTDDFIVIHPSVYANFLLCYGQYHSKSFSSFRKTLQLLQQSVKETQGGLEQHHALNILAFSHLLDGNLQEAFQVFAESLQLTDKLGNTSNAAAYHIAIILARKFEKQRELDSEI